jgi:hypothetical protein
MSEPLQKETNNLINLYYPQYAHSEPEKIMA